MNDRKRKAKIKALESYYNFDLCQFYNPILNANDDFYIVDLTEEQIDLMIEENFKNLFENQEV